MGLQSSWPIITFGALLPFGGMALALLSHLMETSPRTFWYA
jgi:hypothetical protein